MRAPLRLAFLWHFHQPSYRPPGPGAEPCLPWVRLHAVRGYTDMVDALERHPGVRCTLNWVPVLVEQLRAIVAGSRDEWERRCAMAPAEWGPDDLRFLLPRLQYRPESRRHRAEDRARRLRLSAGVETGRMDAAMRADLLDELMRFHLDWSGARLRRRGRLRALRRVEKGFSVEQRDQLFALFREEIAGLLPRVRRLAESGRVELSCTPYHHPILPLVQGLRSQDFPHADDGGAAFSHCWPADADDHVRRAILAHRDCFQSDAAGMWPAEGALSLAAAECFARHGLHWIATDEALLFASKSELPRHALYRPATLATKAGPIKILFRDRDLSDRIGFRYSKWSATRAVDDFVGRLEEIRAEIQAEIQAEIRAEIRAETPTEAPAETQAPTVVVILDGENPWENYRGAGAPFLSALYQRLEQHPDIVTCTASEAIDVPVSTPLEQLATGSWIAGSLDTWAGHPEKMSAWRRLAELRELAAEPLEDLDAQLAESLRVLQSSDWFWWLGDDHPSPLREEFDRLFLGHWRAAMRSLGRDPADDADDALRRAPHGSGELRPLRLPCDWLSPRGRDDDLLQWLGAGELRPLAPGHAMTRGDWPRRVLYGFEANEDRAGLRLHLALWPALGAARVRVGDGWLELQGKTRTAWGLADHLCLDLPSPASEVVELRFEASDAEGPPPPSFRLCLPPDPAAGTWWMV